VHFHALKLCPLQVWRRSLHLKCIQHLNQGSVVHRKSAFAAWLCMQHAGSKQLLCHGRTARCSCVRPFVPAGVGIAVQVGPLFLSELAPFHLRGAFNTQFQLFITIGILVRHNWGDRGGGVRDIICYSSSSASPWPFWRDTHSVVISYVATLVFSNSKFLWSWHGARQHAEISCAEDSAQLM
jgi:hypothetical protein